jgi:hypothetical protein
LAIVLALALVILLGFLKGSQLLIPSGFQGGRDQAMVWVHLEEVALG